MALVEAIGAPGTICAPDTAQSSHTTPTATTTRSDVARCWSASRVSRRTDSGRATSTSSASSTSPISTATARAVPDLVTDEVDRGSDVGPVGGGVERSAERLEEPHVEDLDDGEHAEDQPDEHGHRASGHGGQDEHERDHDERLERDPQERAGRHPRQLVGSDEGEPHQQAGQSGEHPAQHPAGSALRGGRQPQAVERREPVHPQLSSPGSHAGRLTRFLAVAARGLGVGRRHHSPTPHDRRTRPAARARPPARRPRRHRGGRLPPRSSARRPASPPRPCTSAAAARTAAARAAASRPATKP